MFPLNTSLFDMFCIILQFQTCHVWELLAVLSQVFYFARSLLFFFHVLHSFLPSPGSQRCGCATRAYARIQGMENSKWGNGGMPLGFPAWTAMIAT